MLHLIVKCFILHRRTLRHAALLLVPLLLFAQGLRLCLHADTVDHARTLAVHLESNLSAVDDHDTSTGDVDVSLAVLIKAFHSALAVALVTSLMLLAYLPRRLTRHISLPEFRFSPFAVYSLTPPLRAPPR